MIQWQEIVVDVLGHNIRELRKSRGWTQEVLSDQLGVSRVTIARIETGCSMPDWAFACRVADLFEVSTDDLRQTVTKPMAHA